MFACCVGLQDSSNCVEQTKTFGNVDEVLQPGLVVDTSDLDGSSVKGIDVVDDKIKEDDVESDKTDASEISDLNVQDEEKHTAVDEDEGSDSEASTGGGVVFPNL